MICEEAQEFITGLVDNELSAVERRSIENHLEECRNCQLTYRNEIALKQQIRAAAASLDVPLELREKISALGEQKAPVDAENEGLARVFGWLPTAGLKPAVAWAALVIIFIPVVYLWWPSQSVSLAALETHQNVLSRKVNLLQAESAAHLKKQMVSAVEGRFAPMGYDFSAMKLQPVAGLIQNFGDRKILVVSYQGEGPAITCFTFLGTGKEAPSDAALYFDVEKKIDFYTFSRGGVNGVLHREGDVICILVSQMPMSELLAIARAKARHT